MSEPSSSNPPHAHAGPATAHAWYGARAATARGRPRHDEDDPVSEWLLEQRQLDASEFAVLFAIHKLNARRRRSAWIRRTQLCRSSGLGPVRLARVLSELRQRGLVGLARHPVDSSRARYLLVVGSGR